MSECYERRWLLRRGEMTADLQSLVMPALFTKMSGAPYFSVIASQKVMNLCGWMWKAQLALCGRHQHRKTQLHIQTCRMGMRDMYWFGRSSIFGTTELTSMAWFCWRLLAPSQLPPRSSSLSHPALCPACCRLNTRCPKSEVDLRLFIYHCCMKKEYNSLSVHQHLFLFFFSDVSTNTIPGASPERQPWKTSMSLELHVAVASHYYSKQRRTSNIIFPARSPYVGCVRLIFRSSHTVSPEWQPWLYPTRAEHLGPGPFPIPLPFWQRSPDLSFGLSWKGSLCSYELSWTKLVVIPNQPLVIEIGIEIWDWNDWCNEM